jgi:hypothetical protein
MVKDVEKNPWLKLAVAVLSAPVAIFVFDWAGFEWSRSVWGWIIFLSSDAGMTSFVGSALSMALMLRNARRRPG